MQKRSEEIWSEYMTIKGGDFLNWHEGLSPIEKKIWKKKFDEVQCNWNK